MEEEHKNEPPPSTAPKTATLPNGVHVTQKAIKNWRKLAEKPGNKAKQLEAATSLVECYRSGICVDKDEKEAHKYEKKAAMLGHAICQYNLSVKYAQGIGVEKNLEISAMWCGKAAAQGYADAQSISALSTLKALEWKRTLRLLRCGVARRQHKVVQARNTILAIVSIMELV